MKFALAALTLVAAGPALAQPAPTAPDSFAAKPAPVEAVGQIKAVDAKAGVLTIHHGPIAPLGWPAMTMTFKATAEVLAAAKPGQTVTFTLSAPDNQVIAIEPR